MNQTPDRDMQVLSLPEPDATGKAYWRSLDQLANSPSFREWVEKRFPESMRQLLAGGIDRRHFLHLMAASLGLAGLAGCRRPDLEVLPYTKRPEEILPGLPTYYATAMPRPGGAFPVLVESHEGRPTKIEGNPKHPASGGATDALAQASVLDLYDPDRSRTVLRDGASSSWRAFDAFATSHFAKLRRERGRGLHIVSEDLNSPALDLLREHLKEVMPEAQWHVYEPIDNHSVRAGAAIAFGRPVQPSYHFDKAEVVVALDSDFLGTEADSVRHLRDFAQARRVDSPSDKQNMNRLYAVECQYTVTGGMSDHRLRLAARHVVDYALALAKHLLLADPVVPAPGSPAAKLRQAIVAFQPSVSFDPRWIAEVAADLRKHHGRSLVLAGRRQPALVHAVTHLINGMLGNLGTTVELQELPGQPESRGLAELAEAMRGEQVTTLVVLGGNPAYNAPADLRFAALMKRVPNTIRLGLHVDETSRQSTWHLPAAHYLESWGDARTSDGTLVPVQPMIEPLFGGRSALEVIARISGYDPPAPYEIVRRAFRAVSHVSEAEFEPAWRKFLHDGQREGTAYPVHKARLQWGPLAEAVRTRQPSPEPLSVQHLELVYYHDAKVDDGRFANNGWLQEAPEPITKLTWDNAALFSPQTARELKITTGDVVALGLAGRTLEIVAQVLPGQADHTVAVALGYGRTVSGRVGRGVGSNAYALRTSTAPEMAAGLKVTKTGRTHKLACTQDHFTMEGRDLVREQNLMDSLAHPAAAAHETLPTQLYAAPSLNADNQWGMAIDLNTCVGCNACVVACQSENNIPIVGKDEVARGREMHWIRIDRYFSGDEADPGLVHQPVACAHCENAPCEAVCPVNATVHSPEGLNVQVYNRCIGTRYCMNNCPYKVRRFNFFNYNERPLDELRIGPLAENGMAETLKMQKNPDVTVRIRGVMEKCTYCVQRIERGKIGARVAGGDSDAIGMPDGTIVPACAQACSAQAIVFGDLADPQSRVSQVKQQSRNYSLLGELNTKPRTTYLARLRNPNPKMPAAQPASTEALT